MVTQGTREFAEKNINIQKGCKYGCVYCYAYFMARRFKRVENQDEWMNPVIYADKIVREWRMKREGIIMFPSSHDIYTENYAYCIVVLTKLLELGNKFLIVTKADENIIKNMCFDLQAFKDQIEFRITITTLNPKLSLIFEPKAPLPISRFNALKYAFERKFKTSVLIEPYLDASANKITELIKKVEPYSTESIWLGIMSNPTNIKRIPSMKDFDVKTFRERYSREFIRENINDWRNASGMKKTKRGEKIKLNLKDSIKNMGFI